MDSVLRTVLAMSCQDAVIRFFAALDAGRMEEVAKAFADDGIWHRQGAELRGADEVSRALAARPAGRVSAHLVQNLIVDLEDEENARVHYLALTYRHDGSGDPVGVAPLGQPFSIAAYEDRMRRSGDTWLVQERQSRTVFASQTS